MFELRFGSSMFILLLGVRCAEPRVDEWFYNCCLAVAEPTVELSLDEAGELIFLYSSLLGLSYTFLVKLLPIETRSEMCSMLLLWSEIVGVML